MNRSAVKAPHFSSHFIDIFQLSLFSNFISSMDVFLISPRNNCVFVIKFLFVKCFNRQKAEKKKFKKKVQKNMYEPKYTGFAQRGQTLDMAVKSRSKVACDSVSIRL